MAPLVLPITVKEAKELTGRIKRCAEETWKYLAEAYERKAWQPMGYKSWKAYTEAEFGMSERHAYRLVDQGAVTKALKAAADEDSGTDTRVSPSVRESARIKPNLTAATDEITERVQAGESPETVVPEVVHKYGAPPPRSDDPGPAPEPSADVEDGIGSPSPVLDITDPTEGQGNEGAEVEGDVDLPRQRVDDGPVGHDHGDSAPEPSPVLGAGGSGGVVVVPPSPSLTVGLAVEFLLETPDWEVQRSASNDDLRMLTAWAQRNLAARGFEDPHTECREHLANVQRLLDQARAA